MNKNVLDKLKSKFGKVKPCSGGNYRIKCPTCDPKDANKLKRYINPNWSLSNCFICGKLLPLKDLLSDDLLITQMASEHSSAPMDEYPYATILPYTKCQKLSDLPSGEPVKVFLEKDHLFQYDYYDDMGIRYIPMDGGSNIRFDSGFVINTAESLFFPVFKGGVYVGWQLRFIPGTWNGDRYGYMRYLHLFPKGQYLFNYDQAKQYSNVVVVEGVKKSLKLCNAVATFGKGISEGQKQLIQEWKSITLILDGEDKTQELARSICAEFKRNGRNCVNIDLREYGYDSPDEVESEKLQEIIKKTWQK